MINSRPSVIQWVFPKEQLAEHMQSKERMEISQTPVKTKIPKESEGTIRRQRRSGSSSLARTTCLLVILSIMVISIAFGHAEKVTITKFRPAQVSPNLGNLSTHTGVRSNIECASLCTPPQCSAYNYSIVTAHCRLFHGDTTPDSSSNAIFVYRRPRECPTREGFQAVVVRSETFCLSIPNEQGIFDVARDRCRAKNSVLVYFDTLSTYEAVKKMPKPGNVHYVWTSLTDKQEEGKFVHENNGRPPKEGPLWLNGKQPEENRNNNCGLFFINDNAVRANYCNHVNSFVCQKFL